MIKDLLMRAIFDLRSNTFTYKNALYVTKEIPGAKKNFLYSQNIPNLIKPRYNIMSKLNIVADIGDADFALVPHPWISIKDNSEYTKYLYSISQLVPLVIANTDDRSPKCDLPNTLQLRTFLHPRESNYRKIIFPYPAKQQKFVERVWEKTPHITFVGYVPPLTFGSLTSKSINFLHSPINSSVYLNRKISANKLTKLSKVFDVTCIRRPSFTLLENNPNLLEHVVEYEKILRDSDYVLCPRGFGNVSIRFYEAISCGATPILVNSGTKLPALDNNDFWNDNILTVNLLSNWTHKILMDWEYLKNKDNYKLRQLQNAETFTKYLNFETYCEIFFSNYLS